MGFLDRDYQRDNTYDRSPGFHFGGDMTLTTKLVIAMLAIYVLQIVTRGPQVVLPDGTRTGDAGRFTELFSLHTDLLTRPWLFFQLVTYGFLHDPFRLQHIAFNMIALWFFGRSVEYRYGRREYLTFYLAAVVIAGLAWLIAELIATGGRSNAQMMGASGAIAAVLVLFCINFPHQLVYIWGVLPIPAWVFAVLFIGQDMWGALRQHTAGGPNVAYTAHLGGALFAFLYYLSGTRLERWAPGAGFLKRLKPRPRLRVHDPTDREAAAEAERQVDEILKKIQEHGRDSLTRGERRILEDASREYQKRRQ
jgi:membrane associated rhomboid family serine protease